jgi:tRNA pseudouridine55 synthase
MENENTNLEGILLVNKSIGKTSFSIIHLLRKLTKIQKIGHTGTLDPFATGLMLILIGKKYTKLSDLFIQKEKQYLAKLKFGEITDSYDIDGKIEHISSVQPSEEQIHTVIEQFQGEIEQIPPMFSAKKINGKKLYKLARQGIEIERKPIKVFVDISFISYNYPYLELDITCSKGTYIRSIANDIGKKLGCGAYLNSLTRIKLGKYLLKDSVAQNDLTEDFPLNEWIQNESHL